MLSFDWFSKSEDELKMILNKSNIFGANDTPPSVDLCEKEKSRNSLYNHIAIHLNHNLTFISLIYLLLIF